MDAEQEVEMVDDAEMEDLVKGYDRELPHDREIEDRLSASIQRKNYVTLTELKEIVSWKFEGDGQKLPRLLRILDAADDAQIQELSRAALAKDAELSDLGRIKILDELPATGPAVASVILTFWNPGRYGVYDFHAWDALAGESLVDSDEQETVEEYAEVYLPVLRDLASKKRRTVRYVEKAYYWKEARKGH